MITRLPKLLKVTVTLVFLTLFLLGYGLGWTYKCDIGKIAIVAVGINHCN